MEKQSQDKIRGSDFGRRSGDSDRKSWLGGERERQGDRSFRGDNRDSQKWDTRSMNRMNKNGTRGMQFETDFQRGVGKSQNRRRGGSDDSPFGNLGDMDDRISVAGGNYEKDGDNWGSFSTSQKGRDKNQYAGSGGSKRNRFGDLGDMRDRNSADGWGYEDDRHDWATSTTPERGNAKRRQGVRNDPHGDRFSSLDDMNDAHSTTAGGYDEDRYDWGPGATHNRGNENGRHEIRDRPTKNHFSDLGDVHDGHFEGNEDTHKGLGWREEHDWEADIEDTLSDMFDDIGNLELEYDDNDDDDAWMVEEMSERRHSLGGDDSDNQRSRNSGNRRNGGNRNNGNRNGGNRRNMKQNRGKGGNKQRGRNGVHNRDSIQNKGFENDLKRGLGLFNNIMKCDNKPECGKGGMVKELSNCICQSFWSPNSDPTGTVCQSIPKATRVKAVEVLSMFMKGNGPPMPKNRTVLRDLKRMGRGWMKKLGRLVNLPLERSDVEVSISYIQ